MSKNTYPCPNGGKCGSNSHYPDSEAYLECLRIASSVNKPGATSLAPDSSPPPTVDSASVVNALSGSGYDYGISLPKGTKPVGGSDITDGSGEEDICRKSSGRLPALAVEMDSAN